MSTAPAWATIQAQPLMYMCMHRCMEGKPWAQPVRVSSIRARAGAYAYVFAYVPMYICIHAPVSIGSRHSPFYVIHILGDGRLPLPAPSCRQPYKPYGIGAYTGGCFLALDF